MPSGQNLADEISSLARSCGASVAGLVSVAFLKDASSGRHRGPLSWPSAARTVCVLGLHHPEEARYLDWWGGAGGTAGNRALGIAGRRLSLWLNDEHNADARVLPYHADRGGVFLKDAAVLAGLGVIGANNLLVTPEFGPRIRLRALSVGIEVDHRPSGEFDPCANCDRPCVEACPRDAFPGGQFEKARCSIQMQHDEAHPVDAGTNRGHGLPSRCVAYCRACELACPVGA